METRGNSHQLTDEACTGLCSWIGDQWTEQPGRTGTQTVRRVILAALGSECDITHVTIWFSLVRRTLYLRTTVV